MGVEQSPEETGSLPHCLQQPVADITADLQEGARGQASTIGSDVAKRAFYTVLRNRPVLAKLLRVCAAQPPCMVAMEACAGAHHRAHEMGRLGHMTRLQLSCKDLQASCAMPAKM